MLHFPFSHFPVAFFHCAAISCLAFSVAESKAVYLSPGENFNVYCLLPKKYTALSEMV